jgi:hypothetical protein
VACAAVAALNAPRGGGCSALAGALRDPAREVRSAVVAALAAQGDRGALAARTILAAPEESAVAAAMRVLAGVGSAAARGLLRSEYAARVREAIAALHCARVLGATGAGVPRFTLVANGTRWRALRLAWRHSPVLGGRGGAKRERARAGSRRVACAPTRSSSQLGESARSRQLDAVLEPIPSKKSPDCAATSRPARLPSCSARARCPRPGLAFLPIRRTHRRES